MQTALQLVKWGEKVVIKREIVILVLDTPTRFLSPVYFL